MTKKPMDSLSRRERQIMNIIYKRGKASGLEVQEDLPDRVNYSTVRALLRILVEKGHLKCETQGQKYIYYPLTSKENAAKHAMKDLVGTFFEDSVEKAVVALLEYDKSKLSDNDLRRLSELINKAREEEDGNG